MNQYFQNKANSNSRFGNALDHNPSSDIFIGIAAVRIWGTFGWHDIKQRYRRSVLGPFWFTLSTLILVLVLGILYSTLLNQEISEYLPYLAVGLVLWQYFASSINEGCSAFIEASQLIKEIRLPLTIHVCRIAWRNFIILLHSLPVVMIMLIAFGHWPDFTFFLVPVGLLMLFLHSIWVGLFFGVLCARFRDIPPIILNLVQVAFFVTPVLWTVEILNDKEWVATYNPLYHMLEIVRAPILGRPIYMESWVWSFLTLVIGFISALYLMKRFRNRVPYWL
jgi:ABC-2 type transport system permease protein